MHDVTVIDDPAAAEVSLDPIRARLLSALAEPGSATTLGGDDRADAPEGQLPPPRARAPRADRARRGAAQGQLHRARHAGHRRVVRHLPDRAVGGCSGPRAGAGPALGPVAARRRRAPGLRGRRADRRSGAAGKPVATLGIDSEVRFASARIGPRSPSSWPTPSTASSPSTTASTRPSGRDHRFVVALHPKITKPTTEEPQS